MKSYLDQLQFDKHLRNSFIAKYLTNFRLVALLVMTIVVLGVASYVWLPRRLNPEVNIPIVVVSTVLPGAGPEDVESLVTIPLENEIKNADGIDIMSSTSNENVSVITLQFKSSVDVDEARDEVQRLANNANDLPSDATTTQVQSLDFEDVPVWQFAITSSADQATLETIATQLEQEIEAISNVDRVEVSGVESKEIQITVDPTTIAELGVNPQQLASAITDATSALPAGNITTQQTDFAVSINPAVDTLDTLRQTPIQLNQQVMQLQNIATVQYRSAPYQSRSYIAQGDGAIETAVSFAVYKTSGSDIESTQQAVEERVTTWLTPYEETIHLVTLENVAKDISDQFADLGSNFASTIVLVFLTLLVFLGIRQATIASLSIPMTFLVSFFIMNITGQTLNFLTMFSLLLALGVLVDDAIVIVQSMTAYSRTGRFSAEEAGLLVWRDFIVPIWTTTITTVWAFVPLLLATGIIGEFIKSIPIVVSSTLLTSTAVAVLITLPMMIILLDLKVPKRVRILGWVLLVLGAVGSILALTQTYAAPAMPVIAVLTIILLVIAWRWRADLLTSVQTSAKTVSASPWYSRTVQTLDTGLINLQPVVDRYQNFMNSVLENKTSKRQVIAAVVIFSIFSYSLVPLGFVQNEFFPETDSDIMYVSVELPSGSNRELTETKTLSIFPTLQAVPEVEVVQANVGQGGSHVAEFTVRLQPDADRQRSAQQIAEELRGEFTNDRTANITVSMPSGGPPAGEDIALKIIGPELSELQAIANDIDSYLVKQPGVINIDRSIKGGPSKLVFVPNREQIASQGLTNQQIGFWLRTALSGFELDEITLPGDSEATSIQFRMFDRLLEPEELSQISLLTQSGPVPIPQFGEFVLESNPTSIAREDGQRTLTVTAEVTGDASVNQTNQKLLAHAETLKLPPEYSFDNGGVNEENEKSVQSILQAMIIAILLIVVTMVIQLGSFRQALLVVLVIPLAVSGVFVMFALSGTPLSFPALIGVLALFGIVVNNSIMLVDKINQNMAIGMKQRDAISDAAASRLEPILFSSLTTITGLVPITITDPLWRGLGGGIISGLFFSGAIMLLFIPVLYDMWYAE